MDNPSYYRAYPHAPSHLFEGDTIYFVTSGTYRKAPLFNTPEKRDFLLGLIFEETERWQWRLEAWAVMNNHYHLVARSPSCADTLKRLMMSLHSKSAIWLNRVDQAPGRKVWYQYRDQCLTYQESYFARLNYTHNNPVKHGVCTSAEDYPWCSMRWFMNEAAKGYRATVLSFKIDRLSVEDDF